MRFFRSFAAFRRCAVAALLFIACGGAVAAVLPDEVTFGVRVEQGDRDTVSEWLASGLDPNFESNYIGTGLMIAAWRGDIPMMELFVKHGADVNFENRFKEQALMLAVWKGQREAAGWLVLHGAKVNREGNEWSALHYAAFAGHDEIARYLIENKADINARSTNGSTVLMMAAREGNENIASLLLKHGALRTATNDQGEDAMKWAMRNGHLSVAKLIATEEEFAQAAAKPPETWGEPVVTVAAPPEVEEILRRQRLAQAAGERRTLSDEEYKKIMERVAAMKPAVPVNRRATRLSITAKKGQASKERAEIQYAEPRPATPRTPAQ